MNNKNLVLIVDDEPIIRETLGALMDTSVFDVAFAENGEQGLQLAQELLPDAILLDIMMPKKDGYQVCRLLREHPQLAEVPIIMLTALDDRDAKLAGLMAGADDFLIKPFDGLELQIRLRTILRVNRYRRLMTERARFSWIVENTDDGYLVLAADGRIQYANASAQALLHLPEEYKGINFAFHVEQVYSPHPLDKWATWSATASPLYFVQPETSYSRPFWLLVEAMDAPADTENSRVVRLRNVTDKMSVYQDTRKFHTAVIHKLRTPISLIYTSMTLIEAKMDVIPPEEIKPLVKTAWKGAQRLVDSIRDILNFLDAPLALQVGVPARLEELKNLVTKTSETFSLEDVHLAIPDDLCLVTISLTTYALELILQELLENAKKFHPQHTPHVEIKVEQADAHYIRLSVLDDGLTLTAEQLSWAWLPYFQGEKNFTGELPGMGLGFPTVATMVWQAGGKIRLANRQAGTGIVVELTIPMVDKDNKHE